MGKMCYKASNKMLYHFGGMNSEGVDYQVSLNNSDRKWNDLDKNHSVVLNATKLELCNAPYVYFY